AQASIVREALSRLDIGCELVPVKTSGDRIQDRPLAAVGGKGLFTKELEDALLRNDIDMAVHSMKDVPVVLPPGLEIAALLPREDIRDAFVSHHGACLADLASGARVGTSSVRRQAQVARARADLEIVSLRGNVDTRLAKLDCGEVDAVILAFAGLKRLGIESRATSVLPLAEWPPALSQGAIGIEMRSNSEHASVVRNLNDGTAAICLTCERAFQAALDGSCMSPIAGFAQFVGGILRMRGEVIAPDGSGAAEVTLERVLSGDASSEAAALGMEAGLKLKPRAEQWLAR
ncbi:MAG: hydroxymethylbilane synthase, partial [Alphaproteobacteria bacterium]|nr:hydroxymethylbilane synthase [Alphaproteobacteria bacterium]